MRIKQIKKANIQWESMAVIRRTSFLLFSQILFFAVHPILANPIESGGPGATPFPMLKSSQSISLERETIFITDSIEIETDIQAVAGRRLKTMAVKFDCTYILKNETNSGLDTKIALPFLTSYSGGWPMGFQRLTILEDSRLRPFKKQEKVVSINEETGARTVLVLNTFQVSFRPRERKTIRIEYYSLATENPGNGVYILQTGNYWARPISEAEIIFISDRLRRLGKKSTAHEIMKYYRFSFTEYDSVPEGIRFRFTNFRPHRDFRFSFIKDPDSKEQISRAAEYVNRDDFDFIKAEIAQPGDGR